MENVLNLVWLVLAIVIVALWSTRWRSQLFVRARRADVFRSAIGLLCVLLFMFYAISLSDDLYEMTVVVEDSPASPLRASRVAAPDTHISAPASAVLAKLPFGVVAPEPVAFLAIAIPVFPVPRPASFASAALRAPPCCS